MLRPSSARCEISEFFVLKKRSQNVAKEQNAAPDAGTRPEKPAATGKAGAAAPAKRKKEFKKKRERRIVPHGIVHIAATFNNTQITIADTDGRVVCWSSAGAIGFKGSRKGTPYAAQQASLAAAGTARDQYGMKSVEVKVKGPGSGRESAVRALAAAGLHIVVIRDVTPMPHNGCRPPKRRRV
jgi:small subunit ribosomal protein S11